MTTRSQRRRDHGLDQPGQPAQAGSQAQADQAREQERPAREADGWQILSYMLGGMLLYGGIGWLASHWTGIAILFPLGMILGIGLSIAMIIFRFTRS
jgi:ATP synthase protein I